MEFLYITALLAIFALCLVLFSTARRVLGSSALTSGELSLAQSEDGQSRRSRYRSFRAEPVSISEDEEAEAEMDSEKPEFSQPEMAEDTWPEAELSHEAPAADPELAPVAAMEAASEPESRIEETPVEPQPRRTRRMARSSDRHNIWLECLLLGVSLVVLVQTQRGNARYRTLQANRVA